jgi:hypothetical protein
VLDELKLRFSYAFAQSEFYRPIVEARELGAISNSAIPRSVSSTSRMAT